MMNAPTPHSVRREWAPSSRDDSEAEYSALAVFLEYLFLAWVACAFAAGLFGWGSAEASIATWNIGESTESEQEQYLFAAHFKPPSTREDGSALAIEEIKKFCVSMVAVDKGGQRSKPSKPLCKPVAEFLPSWVVADYWWGDTRPVYQFPQGEKVIARAPVGATCDQRYIRESSQGRTWRPYKTESGVYGAVLCQKQ